MRYSNLRLPGCNQVQPMGELTRTEAVNDRHYVVEILTAPYDGKYVAGYNIYLLEQREELQPQTLNGLYRTERDAKLVMTAFVLDKFGTVLPEEVKSVLILYEWQLRQNSLF